jgi:hypothetical protein
LQIPQLSIVAGDSKIFYGNPQLEVYRPPELPVVVGLPAVLGDAPVELEGGAVPVAVTADGVVVESDGVAAEPDVVLEPDGAVVPAAGRPGSDTSM